MRAFLGTTAVSILVFGFGLGPGCSQADDETPAGRTVESKGAAKPRFKGPWFVDEAAARGLTQLNRTGEPRRKQFIMSTVGLGPAVFDANGDGRLDIYSPNGNWLTGPKRDRFYDGEDRPRNALYIQQEDGTFRDEAAARGVDDDAWSFGSCAADLDNDGDADLIVTNLGPNRLYINDGKGHFKDIAARAGIAGPATSGAWHWSTGIACGDYDRDGRLDVYIASYADMYRWMRENPAIVRGPDGEVINAAVCDWQGLQVYCGPLGLPGEQDHLFHNVGGSGGELRFEDVSDAAGITRDKESGGPLYGFQVLFTDLNRDGWPDIYVANDSVPSFFFENQKDGTFRECGDEYAISVDANGEDMAGMGADCVDMNGDGWPEVHKTNFSYETNNLYFAEPRDDGTVGYRDFSFRTGLKQEVYHDLGWAVLVFDYDHDGRRDLYYANGHVDLRVDVAVRVVEIAPPVVFDYDHDGRRDLYYANGHVYPEVDAPTPRARGLKTSYEQFNKLVRNVSGKRLRFEPVSDPGSALDIKKCSRGAALIDVDNDGDLDIYVININARPTLLVNRHGTRAGHWVQLRLEGDPQRKVNRDGIGCKIKATAGDLVQYVEVLRGQGFLGCHDPRVHLGLGTYAGKVKLEITWTDGSTSEHLVAVDQQHHIRQP